MAFIGVRISMDMIDRRWSSRGSQIPPAPWLQQLLVGSMKLLVGNLQLLRVAENKGFHLFQTGAQLDSIARGLASFAARTLSRRPRAGSDTQSGRLFPARASWTRLQYRSSKTPLGPADIGPGYRPMAIQRYDNPPAQRRLRGAVLEPGQLAVLGIDGRIEY